MIIDFHVHGKISCAFPFNKERFLLAINEAKQEGINSISITEHCHCDNFLEGYNFLNDNYKLVDDYYDVDGFKVFYGVEVTTKQELDILIIGIPKLIVELRNNVISYLNDVEYIDINYLFDEFIQDELLVILAHPYREHMEFPTLKNSIIDRIDAIELNAKDLHRDGIESTKDKITKLSDSIKTPIVCGSDTHHFIQMSSVRNIFKKDCNTVREIKEEIKNGNYETKISTDLNIRVRSAKIIKDLICKR